MRCGNGSVRRLTQREWVIPVGEFCWLLVGTRRIPPAREFLRTADPCEWMRSLARLEFATYPDGGDVFEHYSAFTCNAGTRKTDQRCYIGRGTERKKGEKSACRQTVKPLRWLKRTGNEANQRVLACAPPKRIYPCGRSSRPARLSVVWGSVP